MSAGTFWNRTTPGKAAWRQRWPRLRWADWMVHCGAPNCPSSVRTRPALFARVSGLIFNNRWYHTLECTKEVLAIQCEEILRTFKETAPKRHRLPIGLLLVNRGVITAKQLREALERQRQEGHSKLGYWLRQIVNLEEVQVASALGQQWGCALFPMKERSIANPETMGLPFPILATAKAVPVHCSGNGGALHIAFSERVDHTLLYAVEEMLGCRTIACMGSESEVSKALEQWQRQCPENEICFDTVRGATEIVETICNYAGQLDAREIKLARAGVFIWVAYFGNRARRNLLFRVPTGPLREREELGWERTNGSRDSADIRKDGVSDAVEPV